jgi:hypothetical protein
MRRRLPHQLPPTPSLKRSASRSRWAMGVWFGAGIDWPPEISIEMMPDDGIIAVYGVGDEYAPAFADHGIENLRELVRIYRRSPTPSADQSENG